MGKSISIGLEGKFKSVFRIIIASLYQLLRLAKNTFKSYVTLCNSKSDAKTENY